MEGEKKAYLHIYIYIRSVQNTHQDSEDRWSSSLRRPVEYRMVLHVH